MKSLVLTAIILTFSTTLKSQTWNGLIEIRLPNGKILTRDLVLKPNHKITIGRIFESDKKPLDYRGIFSGGNRDSLKLMRVSRIQRFSSAENYYIESVALSDVNYLNYSRLSAKTSEYLGSGCFIGILGSLVVLVASPLVCIDYSDWKFNSTRYGKWALGSAIGLGASLSVLVAAIHFDNRKIYFKPVGQSRNIKIWSFKRQ